MHAGKIGSDFQMARFRCALFFVKTTEHRHHLDRTDIRGGGTSDKRTGAGQVRMAREW